MTDEEVQRLLSEIAPDLRARFEKQWDRSRANPDSKFGGMFVALAYRSEPAIDAWIIALESGDPCDGTSPLWQAASDELEKASGDEEDDEWEDDDFDDDSDDETDQDNAAYSRDLAERAD